MFSIYNVAKMFVRSGKKIVSEIYVNKLGILFSVFSFILWVSFDSLLETDLQYLLVHNFIFVSHDLQSFGGFSVGLFAEY